MILFGFSSTFRGLTVLIVMKINSQRLYVWKMFYGRHKNSIKCKHEYSNFISENLHFVNMKIGENITKK